MSAWQQWSASLIRSARLPLANWGWLLDPVHRTRVPGGCGPALSVGWAAGPARHVRLAAGWVEARIHPGDGGHGGTHSRRGAVPGGDPLYRGTCQAAIRASHRAHPRRAEAGPAGDDPQG